MIGFLSRHHKLNPKSNNDLLSLVAEVLQETDPILEESIVPRYKKKPKFEREAAAQFYVDSLKPKQSDVNQFIADAGLKQSDADEVWTDNNPRVPPRLPIALGISM